MGASSPTSMGWPFLVAAGRRRDYSTLLAPDFLVADLDYGILETSVRPTSAPGPAMTIDVRTGGGRALTVVYATHLLAAADLTMPDVNPTLPVADPRDEHGRPLRLIYGFVAQDATLSRPDQADLTCALTAALATYRSFLQDEERAGVASSRPFALRSDITPRHPLRAAASLGVLAVDMPEPTPSLAVTPRRLAGAAVIVAFVAVIALIVSGTGRNRPGPPPGGCPTTATSTSTQASSAADSTCSSIR